MLLLSEAMEILKNADKPFYIYVLYKPSGVPFYVGKGTIREDRRDQRVTYHEWEARSNGKTEGNKHKINTIKKIWSQGNQVFYTIDSFHDTIESVNQREIDLIASLGRRIHGTGPLTNLEDGGEKDHFPEESKKKVSEGLKRYYQNNPEALEEMSRRGKERFANNPEERELFRQRSIKANCAANLTKWQTENPDGFAEKAKCHSEYMKCWYKENPDKAENMARVRNEVLRSDSHRAKMADAIRNYAKNNSEADKLRREKARESARQNRLLYIDALTALRDYLIRNGLLTIRVNKPPVARNLSEWKKRGIIPLEVPKYASSAEVWQKFKENLAKLT